MMASLFKTNYSERKSLLIGDIAKIEMINVSVCWLTCCGSLMVFCLESYLSAICSFSCDGDTCGYDRFPIASFI